MVEILMAVYNGEKYLTEQLDSIIEQSFTDWKLIICDDCSTDNTRIIIDSYCRKFSDKITAIYNEENIGVKNNFFKLLSLSTAEYIMFCDQDDIWLKDKIRLTLDCMQKNENNKPLLVHTDLAVIDENNAPVADSMFKMQRIDSQKTALNNLLVQNVVTGCTVMINRKLADIIITPYCETLHDWWIAIVACLFGEIMFLPQPTIKYRRHNNNVRGAKNMSSIKYIILRAFDKTDAKKMLRLGYIQAAELRQKYSLQNEVLSAYADCLDKCKLKKFSTIYKYKIFKQGIVRKIGQMFYM